MLINNLAIEISINDHNSSFHSGSIIMRSPMLFITHTGTLRVKGKLFVSTVGQQVNTEHIYVTCSQQTQTSKSLRVFRCRSESMGRRRCKTSKHAWPSTNVQYFFRGELSSAHRMSSIFVNILLQHSQFTSRNLF